jgi:hypothetical protein
VVKICQKRKKEEDWYQLLNFEIAKTSLPNAPNNLGQAFNSFWQLFFGKTKMQVRFNFTTMGQVKDVKNTPILHLLPKVMNVFQLGA